MFSQRCRRVVATALLGLCGAGAFAQEILVAQIGPFTALPTPEPTEVRDGQRAYFDQVNRSGGIRGRKITLLTSDYTLEPGNFMVRYKEALERQPIALINPIGAGALSDLFKSGALDNSDIVIVGAIPGAEAFRQPGHPKLFHVRGGDKSQIERILLQCKTLGLQRIHVLYENQAVGHAGIAAVQEGSKNFGLGITSTMSKGTPEAIEAAAKEVAAVAPQGAILIGTPGFMAEGLAQLRKAGVNQAAFAMSLLDPRLVLKVAGADGARGLGITQAFPNPNGSNLPIQREFQAAMAKSFPALTKYSPFHLEGYVTARTLVAGMRHISGNITPSALARALHEMGELNLGGFVVDFGKSNVGNNWTDIGVMSASGKLMY
jgi:ABC-type branched-subunit amino acid transport system substrate-binding protein